MAGEPLPGVAGMAQGQQAEPEQPQAGAPEEPQAEPEQPGKLVTGGEALEEQQQNPELKDTGGNRGV